MTETQATNDLTIQNFGAYDVDFVDISLIAHTGEDGSIKVYQAMANLHFVNNKTISHWMVTTVTDIFDECKYCTASKALGFLENLYGNIRSGVMVFNQESDVIEDFNLLDQNHDVEI